MHAREICFLDDIAKAVSDEAQIARMRADILAGDVYIAKNFMSKQRVLEIRSYLEGIGRSSLPNYQRIEPACPNFHRIDRWDPRSYVKACIHSFSFFPWNHDVFGFFELFRPVYQLKNLVSDLPKDSFLGTEPERGCTARLSFQYYPRGIGGINRHEDPFDYHQITVPAMLMSKKGVDFQEGGVFVERSDGERVNLDDYCDYGDVVYFNAQCTHGVQRIDPDAEPDWLSQQGRWIALFAVNKVAGNEEIGNSKDLGDEGAAR
jgi:hypothetical protein